MVIVGRRRGIRGRPWAEMDCWALDLEMTGLDARRDRIVAVGMVVVRDRAIRVGEAFASLVAAPGSPPSGGIAAHHLLPSQLAGAPELPAVVAEIDRRLQGGVLVVHAGGVDLPFLRRGYREASWPWPDPPLVDTLALLRRHEAHRLVHDPAEATLPTRLPDVRAHLGLPAHHAHDALSDAVATAEVLLVLAHRLGARTVGDLLTGR